MIQESPSERAACFELAIPAELNPAQVPIRIAGTKDEPLFCLADVCRVLEIGDASNWARGLDEDEMTTCPVSRTGQVRHMNFLTEAGLYTVLLRSDKPQAKPFRKWVTGEVIPCIRKHGCYPAPETDGKVVPRAAGHEGLPQQMQILLAQTELLHRMGVQMVANYLETSGRLADLEENAVRRPALVEVSRRVERLEAARPLPPIKNEDADGEAWLSVDEFLRLTGREGANAMSLGIRAGQALRRRGERPQRIGNRNYYPRWALEHALEQHSL